MISLTDDTCPPALDRKDIATQFPCLWAIGNLRLLDEPLIGFFCSIRCPGEVILRTYDLAQALRHAEIPLIGGFHSPMEKECLDLLLRGNQPIVVCPARSIERMRIPANWRKALEGGRLLVLSPFESKYRRTTVALARKRNHLVATLASELLVAYAAPGSHTEQTVLDAVAAGKRVCTLALAANQHLLQRGVEKAKLPTDWARDAGSAGMRG